MREYYEVHITFLGGGEPRNIPGWTFSQIDGDPVLGDGVKKYLTRQYPRRQNIDDIVTVMELCAAMMEEEGYTVLRTKVELVVYDNRRPRERQES